MEESKTQGGTEGEGEDEFLAEFSSPGKEASIFLTCSQCFILLELNFGEVGVNSYV